MPSAPEHVPVRWGGGITAGLLAVLAACGADASWTLPQLDGAQSVIFVIERDPPELTAIDLGGPARSIEIGAVDREAVFALLYPFPLATYGLADGPLEVVPAGEPGTPLPSAETVFRTTRDPRTAEWQKVDEPPAWILAIVLRQTTFSPSACAASEGCVSDGRCFRCLPRAAIAAPEPPAPPLPPAVPSFVPCPSGWEEIAGAFGEPTRCEPPSVAIPSTAPPCADGEVRRFGEGECRALGAPCPLGEWRTDLPKGTSHWFVRAGAVSGGDGSAARPFASVAEAIDAASRATPASIMLGEGTFDAALDVPEGVSVLGVCVSRTTLRAADVQHPVLRVRGNAELRDLTIEGAGLLVASVHVTDGATVRAKSIRIVRSASTAWEVSGGAVLEGEALAVEDAHGIGFRALAGTRLVLEDIVVSNAMLEGIRAHDAEVVVRKMRARAVSGSHAAITIGPGGSARLDDTSIEDSSPRGLSLLGPGVTATVSRTFVERITDRSSDSESGQGFVITGGARAHLSAIVVRHPVRAAIEIIEGDLTIIDALLRDTRQLHPPFADGIRVGNLGRLDAKRIQLDRQPGRGIVVAPLAAARIEDFSARDLGIDAEHCCGEGVHVEGNLELRRAWIERTRGAAISVVRGVANLEDLTLHTVRAHGGSAGVSFGIYALRAAVNVARADLEGATGQVFFAASTATITDLEMRAQNATTSEGLSAASGANVHAVRLRADTMESPYVAHQRSSLHLEDAIAQSGRDPIRCELNAKMVIRRMTVIAAQRIGKVVGVLDASDVSASALIHDGLEIQAGGAAAISRWSVNGAETYGVKVQVTARLFGRDVAVRGVRSDGEFESGAGLSIVEHATEIDLDRFRLTDSEFGIVVQPSIEVPTEPIQLSFEDGEIAGNRTAGALIEALTTPNRFVEVLTRDIWYHGNAATLDAR